MKLDKTMQEDIMPSLILGVGGGFAGLVKSGLIEFDEVKKAENITLASNYKNILHFKHGGF